MSLGIIFTIVATFILIGAIWYFYKTDKGKRKDFIFTWFITLLAALIGVFWAIKLTEVVQQHHLNQVTEQKLHVALLECGYNFKIIKNTFDLYPNKPSQPPTTVTIMNRFPDVTAAKVAFQDENIQSVLPGYKVSLLRAYINEISSLAQAINFYNSYVLEHPTDEVFLGNIRSTTAEALAMCPVMLKEFAEYSRGIDYSDKINEVEKQVDVLKEKALKGESLFEETKE